MSKSATFANDLQKFLFQGTAIAALAGVTTLYVGLHSADPTAAGNQSSNEIAYTGYARVAIVRTSSGWAVTGNSASPASTISFPIGTGGSGTATHFSLGTSATGTGYLIHSGALNSSITCGATITPQLTTATVFSEA